MNKELMMEIKKLRYVIFLKIKNEIDALDKNIKELKDIKHLKNNEEINNKILELTDKVKWLITLVN